VGVENLASAERPPPLPPSIIEIRRIQYFGCDICRAVSTGLLPFILLMLRPDSFSPNWLTSRSSGTTQSKISLVAVLQVIYQGGHAGPG
jgi:hypothetical protein